jgi:hypothetical protein
MGGREIVRRHMLYESTIKDFMIDEGWGLEFHEDGSETLQILPSATQETIRSAQRIIDRNHHRKQGN